MMRFLVVLAAAGSLGCRPWWPARPQDPARWFGKDEFGRLPSQGRISATDGLHKVLLKPILKVSGGSCEKGPNVYASHRETSQVDSSVSL